MLCRPERGGKVRSRKKKSLKVIVFVTVDGILTACDGRGGRDYDPENRYSGKNYALTKALDCLCQDNV